MMSSEILPVSRYPAILIQFALVLCGVMATHSQSIRFDVLESCDLPDGSSPSGALVQGPDGAFYGITRGNLYQVGTVFKVATNGTLKTLAYFNGANGAYPNGLAAGNDGNLYGTCDGGVAGAVFQVTTNGVVNAWFPFGGTSGAQPEGDLLLGPDGSFYGTTAFGGAFNGGVGTVFNVTTNGVVTTLASFDYSGGYSPAAGLTWGRDGNLYGTAALGGVPGGGGYGTVFRVTTNGLLTQLAAFNKANGATPVAALTLGNDGNLYGTTSTGGIGGSGTVFQITTNGDLTTLVPFNGPNGASPKANLTLGADGNFYGTTSAGGEHGLGTIFRMTPDGTLVTLVSFSGPDGATPLGPLIPGRDGNFYGTTSAGGVGGLGTTFQVTLDGVLTSLTSFTGGGGRNPAAEMTFGPDGNLYGTTSAGGNGDQGAVFRLSRTGTFTTIAFFVGANGANPQAGLALGNDGSFYGSTFSGGTSNKGTLFMVTTNGDLTTLCSFAGTNGANPQATLALGPDGNFYGTTYFGGPANKGTIFQVSPTGQLRTLRSFASTNGALPQGALILGADGTFYGTTTIGGIGDKGTIFQVSTDGILKTLVFFAGTNGANPRAGLALGPDGFFYGTTYGGGSASEGTIFRVSTNGVLTTLVSLSALLGYNPQAGLTLSKDGTFYGTTSASAGGLGTVFQVTTNGVFTNLVSLSAPSGTSPKAPLTIAGDGGIYGSAYSGGGHGLGTIFRLAFPASLVVQPRGVRVASGGSASFSATAAGSSLSYQWFVSSGRTAMAGLFMQGPQVQFVFVTDEGSGYVSAPQVRFLGSGVSASAVAVVNNGRVTSLNLLSRGSYSTPPIIQIDNPLGTMAPIPGQTNATLTIPSVADGDETNYFVVVTNNYGTASSAMVGLVILRPPQGLSITNIGAGIQVQVAGRPGFPFIVQSATNLVAPVNWQPVSTNQADANGILQFIETNQNGLQKFYRAVAR